MTERGPISRLLDKSLEKGSTEKIHRRSAGEGLSDKMRKRRSVRKGS